MPGDCIAPRDHIASPAPGQNLGNTRFSALSVASSAHDSLARLLPVLSSALKRREAKVCVDIQAIFGISILMSFVVFGLVAKFYIWPHLQILDREAALLPLVVPHTFRFTGLSFLVPGVVSSSLPSAFAAPAAYGDLVAAILALAASLALSKRWPLSILLIWLFNVWGAADLIFAFVNGLFIINLDARMLGAAFYIPTAFVPPLLVTHGLIFRLLVRGRQ